MRNNKELGFTLIELVAIILILAGVLLIIAPLVTNNVQKSEEIAETQNKDSIVLSSRNWGSDNKNYLPENGKEICVSVKALIDEGYLDNKIKDQYRNGSVLITNTDGAYYYNYQDKECDNDLALYREVIFDYKTNGGNKNSERLSVIPGNKVDLSRTGTKSGYDFVGWNSNDEAHTGFEEFTMPSKDVTLYAIYKKDIEVTYVVEAGIQALENPIETYFLYNNDEEVTITLPSIMTETGYAVLGWYDGNQKVGNSNEEYTISKDITLTAKAEALDEDGPEVEFDPYSQSQYTEGTAVEITLTDLTGIKAGQRVYYAWSTSSSAVPTFTNYITTTNSEGAKTTTITVPKSASSNLTGTYYLWIREGISDTLGNLSENTVSGAFRFDHETPTLSLATSSTSNSITVSASAYALSGISKYEYRINNGSWVSKTTNTHTFTGLKQNTTYTIEVRATSGVGNTVTKQKPETTKSIPVPTFTEAETNTGKDVTITYPSGCGSQYTCTYIKDGGSAVKVNSTRVIVPFTNSGTVVAIVSDGTNEVSSSYNVEIMATLQSWGRTATTDFHNKEYKSKITSAEVVTYNDVPSNAVDSWDVGSIKNGSVMAWVINDPANSGYYKLYIGGDGGVIANKDSSYIFLNFTSLQTIDLTKLNTQDTTNMTSLFASCTSLTNLDISNFDTSKVTNMNAMFKECTSIVTLDVSNFDTGQVTNIASMFASCTSLTKVDVSGFDTRNITTISRLFEDCSKLTSVDVSNWNTSNVKYMGSVFYGCSQLTSVDVSKWNTSNVTSISMMFRDCYNLTKLDVSNWKTSNVTSMYSVFADCSKLTVIDVSDWNTSKVTDMHSLFSGCKSLTSLDVSNFDTSSVSAMYAMFYNCNNLTSLDVSNFDTSKAKSFYLMFSGCYKIKYLDVSDWDTSNVTTFSSVFSNCDSLTTIDVNNWNTSKATDMGSVFSGCSSLTSINLSKWDTSNVKSMNSMFGGCTNLISVNVSNFDTSNVTNMSSMFHGCTSLTNLSISNFDTRNVTNMARMFYYTKSLENIYVGANWTTANATTDEMFYQSGVSSVTRV